MITTGFLLYQQRKKKKAADAAEAQHAQFEEQKKVSQRAAFYASIEGVELSGSSLSLSRQNQQDQYAAEGIVEEPIGDADSFQTNSERPYSYDSTSSGYGSRPTSYDSAVSSNSNSRPASLENRTPSYHLKHNSYDSTGSKGPYSQRICSPIPEEPRRLRSAAPSKEFDASRATIEKKPSYHRMHSYTPSNLR